MVTPVTQLHHNKIVLNILIWAIRVKMIEFILMVNKQGHTRLSQYYTQISLKDRAALEYKLIHRCLNRPDDQCSFFYLQQHKIAYRKYASLYLIIGSTEDSNELGLYEFIHNIVETFDKYFQNVCELDIMFNLEKAHFILNEMVMNGMIIDTNKTNILYPLHLLDKANSGTRLTRLM